MTMKVKATIVMICAALVIIAASASLVSCSYNKQGQEFTLTDAPTVLDLSSLLPSRFEHIDAASEELSNSDLGLGPDWSEVELFRSQEPYELIYVYLTIMEKDADSQTRSLVADGLKAGAPSEIKPDMFGQDIAQKAVAGAVRNPEGGGTSVHGGEGWELKILRHYRVFVAFYRISQSPDKQSLDPMIEQVWQRIGRFSQ